MVILYLSKTQVEEIHRNLKPPPKALGYLYEGGVDFMLYQVEEIYENESERDAIIGKAAYLWHTLSFNQYFADGNKRLGFVIADTFLRINGIMFIADVSYKHEISTGIVNRNYDVEYVRQQITQSLK
jgi:prophage maintenance system killer protein